MTTRRALLLLADVLTNRAKWSLAQSVRHSRVPLRFEKSTGGLAEGTVGFKLQHDEFVFFPTWEHQHADSIRPEFHQLLEKVKPPDRNVLEVRYLARVSDVVQPPPEIAAMQKVAGYHIWAEPFIRMRYEYRPDQPVFLVVPQVFRLAQVVRIPRDRRYSGCRSWVTLHQDVEVTGVQAVLPRNEFRSARDALLAELGEAGAGRQVKTR